MASSYLSPVLRQTKYEETMLSPEIEAILWFDNNDKPKSLQDLGFELKMTLSFSHLFLKETEFIPVQVIHAEREELSVIQTQRMKKRREEDDDSWMPAGWRKVGKQRPTDKGKFAGYVDKKYYAPGVRKPFRSKVEAIRYLNGLN